MPINPPFDLSGVSNSNLTKRISVTSPTQLAGTLDSTIEYFIDGIIDFTGTGISIEVPQGGLNLAGYDFDISQLICSDDNYTMFTSPVGGSGNVLGRDYSMEVSGTNSKVYDLVGDTGDEAFEFTRINYNNCTSLGEIDNYRQGLETGTGRFGGTPELTFSGNWSGMRISTSIVRGLSNISALFKTGTGLTFDGRFITDINCDLPSSGALLDFTPANIVNDESLVIQGAFVTRSGVVDPSDAGLTPNIDQDSIKSNWDSNTGLANTTKYIKASTTSEVVTPIASINTYYPLLGTFTTEKEVHFDMPVNGEFRLLTGTGDYLVSGDITVEGTASNVIDIRVTKSTDGGSTWPTEVNHISRVINNLAGGRDVAFFPISFIANLNKNDRLRVEVENRSSSNNVTMELDSFFIVSEL